VLDLLWSLALVIKEKLEEHRSGIFQVVSVILTLGSYSSAIAINVLLYDLLPKWLSVCNSVAIGVLFIAALVNINPNNTILLSGLALLYIQCISYILGMARSEISTFEYNWKLESLMIVLLGLVCMSMLHRGSGKLKTCSSSLNQILGMNT
jgi:hypothetical protein